MQWEIAKGSTKVFKPLYDNTLNSPISADGT